ncbi:hypothetical protein A628_01852 [Salmonella enterica subsp. enterica serovar Cubana str. 76814]|uniref:Uncharacterized protein n=1 Tax=Salmonella enterica subsp. enterica serovar Cubana str. 76814 TaxID=1192560 RepID=V7IQH0_SALET|nr:hypothetical protein A628_01852 [Salmonella enterica subsp. enterica serovar Cubana str. 76814]
MSGDKKLSPCYLLSSMVRNVIAPVTSVFNGMCSIANFPARAKKAVFAY